MKDTANSARKLLPSSGLNGYVFPCLSDEEWEALGVSPSRAREIKKQGEEEQWAEAEQAKQRPSLLS